MKMTDDRKKQTVIDWGKYHYKLLSNIVDELRDKNNHQNLHNDGVVLTLKETNEQMEQMSVKQTHQIKLTGELIELMRKMYKFAIIVFLIFLFGTLFAVWFVREYHVIGYFGYAT